MSNESKFRFAETRPDEWKRGQELGATTALEHTLIIPGEASIEDVNTVQELMMLESITRESAFPETKFDTDTEGAAAYALAALEAIYETLNREAGISR